MIHTTTCTLCGTTIYPCEGKQCETEKCPIRIEPQPEPDNSWTTKIPEKFEGLGGVERDILSETLVKSYTDKPKVEGM